jgi:hypothetical protein
MHQSNRIVIAFLILFIGAVTFFSLQYLYNNTRSAPASVFITEDTTSYISLKRESGKTLFYSNCASCHSLTKLIEVPPLIVTIENDFWVDSTHIYDFIRDPKSVANLSYIRKLKEAYSNMGHPAFSSLTNNDIDNMIFYIKDSKRLRY